MTQMLIFVSLLVKIYRYLLNHQSKTSRGISCFDYLSNVFRSNKLVNLILPLLVILSKDENLIVRQTCFESLVDLRNQLNDSKSTEQVGEMIISLVKFGLSSKASTFISTIALRLSDLCQVLTSKKRLRNFYQIIFFLKFFILMNMNLFMRYFPD